MAVDINGKWQKRKRGEEKWEDFNDDCSLTNSPMRNRLFFRFLYDHCLDIDDDAEKELIAELSKEFDRPSFLQKSSIEEINSEGWNFWHGGSLTLDELRKFKKDPEWSDIIEFFTGWVETYIEKNYADMDMEYRVLFVCDN